MTFPYTSCVIVLAIEENDGVSMVTVAPVTHSEPANPDEAIESRFQPKAALGWTQRVHG
jgi:hypothetical protein